MKKHIIFGTLVIAAIASRILAPAPAAAQVGTQGNVVSEAIVAPMSAGVSIKGFQFGPATLTINQGETVQWTNQDTTAHTSTSTSDEWDSGALAQGQSFRHTFDTPGNYSYACSFHPGMHGTIIVHEAAPTDTPVPTATNSPQPSPTRTQVPPTQTQAPAATLTPQSEMTSTSVATTVTATTVAGATASPSEAVSSPTAMPSTPAAATATAVVPVSATAVQASPTPTNAPATTPVQAEPTLAAQSGPAPGGGAGVPAGMPRTGKDGSAAGMVALLALLVFGGGMLLRLFSYRRALQKRQDS
ncbi:MAG: cupredoxin domain-containing protein [Chloroflexota bacterium]|nr:cupredoxin domain-containing protein [Chloroflexota bacterium]